MQPSYFIVPLVGVALLSPVLTLAQTSPAQPNSQGDYSSNVGYTLGTAPGGLSPGYLWQVVSPGLNCRSAAKFDSRVIRHFRQGDVLQVDVGRGGSDEVLQNAQDANKKPWMRVRSSTGESYNCYVRANRRYILPKR